MTEEQIYLEIDMISEKILGSIVKCIQDLKCDEAIKVSVADAIIATILLKYIVRVIPSSDQEKWLRITRNNVLKSIKNNAIEKKD